MFIQIFRFASQVYHTCNLWAGQSAPFRSKDPKQNSSCVQTPTRVVWVNKDHKGQWQVEDSMTLKLGTKVAFMVYKYLIL